VLTAHEEETLARRRLALAGHGWPADEFPDHDVLDSPVWVRRGEQFLAFPGWRITRFAEIPREALPVSTTRSPKPDHVDFHPRGFEVHVVWEASLYGHEPGPHASWYALGDGDVVAALAFRGWVAVVLPKAVVGRASWFSNRGVGASLTLVASGRFVVADVAVD
jgi:hypothetical protein